MQALGRRDCKVKRGANRKEQVKERRKSKSKERDELEGLRIQFKGEAETSS
jgi:hypothetical protein